MTSYLKTKKYSSVDIDSPIASRLISYPKFDLEESKERLKEIKSIGITKILFSGPTQIDNFQILGKGHSGIVLCVMDKFKKKYALKIRRTDSCRKNSIDESILLKKANSIGIGPKLFGHTKNLILMDLISGLPIIKFLDHDINKNMLSSIAKQIFLQCYQLDKIHLDHGELNKINNHVFVSLNKFNNICIIDFESSSMNRRPSNVTSVTQALFLYGPLSKIIQQYLSVPNKEVIINSLQLYKKNQNKENFSKLLSLITNEKSY